MARLPVLLIGQTPRPDLEAEIAAAAPALSFACAGALDGMGRDQIAAAWPADGPDALFTTLPSGERTQVSKAAVTVRVAAMLRAIEGPVLLACTGVFTGLPEHPGLVQPSAVLDALAAALLPRGRLGLFVPLPEQVPVLTAARRRDGLDVQAVAVAPGSGGAAFDAAAAALAPFRPDLAILDCISYTRADKARVAQVLRCPVLLSVAVATRAAASLMPE